MSLNFPSSPILNELYPSSGPLPDGRQWRWNGYAWDMIFIFVGNYTTNIGDSTNSSFNIIHNLNKTDIFVQVREISTGIFVYPDIVYNSTNDITITFTTIPSTNQYKVSISGF